MSHGKHDFLIVAIGASAGGLEALEHFFAKMPPDAGMAFAVIQHLAPDHTSSLPHLLAKQTRMSVVQVEDETPVAPNCVYVIPPNAALTIDDGVLRIAAPTEPRGLRRPIDDFFTSLANENGEKTVGIILSGTGADGTLGLKTIKELGGMVLAQNPESAKYDAILRSAIATGLVDHILAVEEMPAKLIEYAAHLAPDSAEPDSLRKQIDGYAGKIHLLLKQRSGHDFSQYKEGTVTRRLERRMQVLHIENVKEYVQVLEDEPSESDQLFKDLLIGVTQFFRDPDAFDTLSREVIPKLFDAKEVRVCIVGCASGEEAYSLAILLHEHAATLKNAPKIHIFATDIDERGLETARKGRYPANIAERVSPERLERFFIKQDGFYQIKREVRECCIFSHHSFIKDPPFSRLDLITCRNVMIYLSPDLQQKLIPLFHYALRPGRYLFLGPSENVTAHRDLFRTVDKKSRIFQRKESLPHIRVKFPLSDIIRPNQGAGKQPDGDERYLPKQLERIILQRYRPACVTVKENGDTVYFSGPTSNYLEQPTGSPDTNVVNMAREGLRMALRSALHRAVSTRERVVQTHLSMQTAAGSMAVRLTVEPLPEFREANLYMVVFEEAQRSASPGASVAEPVAEETIHHLESELQIAQQHAQGALEELETTNEELQSANEEFQSTNEELETSKEELQSFNEELETVNAELNRKVGEADSANSDLQNLLNSTQIATIFLDNELRIRNFTPAAGSVFHLIPGDIGRPITHLAAPFDQGDLTNAIKEVLQTLEVREQQLHEREGQWFQVRILPYRTVNNLVDGVVITFQDITRIKEAKRQALEARRYAEGIVETVRTPLLVLDADLYVKSANKAFYDEFHTFGESPIGRLLYDLGSGQWDIPDLRRLLTELLPKRKQVKDFQVNHDFPGKGKRIVLLNARQIEDSTEKAHLILLSLEDVTESSTQLLRLNEDLRHIAYATSHDLQEPLRMVISYTQLLARNYHGKLDRQADQFISYAVDGAQRMERLLGNLREYWSVDENWREHPNLVDCNAVFDKAIKNLEESIRFSGAQVNHELLPTVATEEIPLVLLFQNLISNAIKYRRPDMLPLVNIRAWQDGGFWQFSVSDNGIGIETRYLDIIFVPFKRLYTADKYPGSGLGLAICKKIVERAGGRIWADSSGQGSDFRFTIPIPENEA